MENVELIQASDYASVPEVARKRLGMSPGRQNLLIRVTLRSLDGTVSKRKMPTGSTTSSIPSCTRERRISPAPRTRRRDANLRHELWK